MEVKIAFDTEKESVEDLKKLVANLQELIQQREHRKIIPSNVPENESQGIDVSTRQKTDGGCEIIPFKNMEETMEKIFSGKN